jgi:hypothetical protein
MASCLALAGCQAGGNPRSPAREAVIAPVAPTVDETGLDSLDMLPTQEADMTGAAMAAQQATFNASTMPGYNPAAGLIGAVIGLAIAKEMEDASLRNKANEPIAPLRAVYAAHWRELGLRGELLREWTAYCGAHRPASGVCLDHVVLRPRLRLLSGGRVLCVRIEASTQDPRGRSAQNAVLAYLSAPLATARIVDINEYWGRGHLHAIAAGWSSAIEKLVPLLPVATAQPEPLPKTGPEAIRFENAAGLFYDRGRILSSEEHRITYRSLDGSITCAYTDRLLSTEAYYEWLMSKPKQ